MWWDFCSFFMFIFSYLLSGLAVRNRRAAGDVTQSFWWGDMPAVQRLHHCVWIIWQNSQTVGLQLLLTQTSSWVKRDSCCWFLLQRWVKVDPKMLLALGCLLISASNLVELHTGQNTHGLDDFFPWFGLRWTLSNCHAWVFCWSVLLNWSSWILNKTNMLVDVSISAPIMLVDSSISASRCVSGDPSTTNLLRFAGPLFMPVYCPVLMVRHHLCGLGGVSSIFTTVLWRIAFVLWEFLTWKV